MNPKLRWTAIIMAAGQGTRMRSNIAKVAHSLAGRPILRHVVTATRDCGIDDCIVVVRSEADEVRAAAGSGVRFAVQHDPSGTAGAIEAARHEAGHADYILIMNGDVPLVLPSTLKRLRAAVSGEDGSTADTHGADLALLTAEVPVEEYGILVFDAENRISEIIETKSRGELNGGARRMINSGQYAVRAEWLWSRIGRISPSPNGERYLTALAAIAHGEGKPAIAVIAEEADEVRGINDRVQLAHAEGIVRERLRTQHMLAGVTIIDPPSTFIDAGAQIGIDTTLYPSTHLVGETSIGTNCKIGPGTIVENSSIAERCVVRLSLVQESTLEADVDVGPYSHLRPGAYICEGAHIGNFAEVKASRLGRNVHMGHFSYIGDAEVGDDVNIGAGTITANYDGAEKHRTVIGDGAFIGSDSMLIAPVRIGRGARTSAGSVVTRDVPDGALAVGAPARIRASANDAAAMEEPHSGR